MEETRWEQKLQAITHIITSPTNTPSIHTQILISTQIPCYLNWDYPPILCNKNNNNINILRSWEFTMFLKRVSRFGVPETSWRSKCPYQQPPPLILAKGVEEAEWGDDDKRKYVRRRMRGRRRLGWDVNPMIPILVPNLVLLALLFWDPFPDPS